MVAMDSSERPDIEISETIVIEDKIPQQPEVPWLPEAIVIAPKIEKEDSKEHDENLREAIALLCSQQPASSFLYECQTIDDSDTDERSWCPNIIQPDPDNQSASITPKLEPLDPFELDHAYSSQNGIKSEPSTNDIQPSMEFYDSLNRSIHRLNQCSGGEVATQIFHEGPFPGVAIRQHAHNNAAKKVHYQNGSNRLRIISVSNKFKGPMRILGVAPKKPKSISSSSIVNGTQSSPTSVVNTASDTSMFDTDANIGRERSKVKRLYEHVLVHHDDSPPPVYDSFYNDFEEISCDFMSNNDNNKHDGSKLDPIDLEDYIETVSKSSRRQHGKLYKCKVCGKIFSSRYSANNHRVLHSGERNYKCSYCDHRFAQESARNRHEVLIHLKSKTFVCHVCDARFGLKQYLDRHVRTHTDERPYSCEFCDKRFRAYSNLRNHLATHSNVRKYKCDFCDKAFKRSDKMKRHLATHAEDKKFRCRKCKRSYDTKQELIEHSDVHKLGQGKCHKCRKTYCSYYYLSKHKCKGKPSSDRETTDEEDQGIAQNVEETDSSEDDHVDNPSQSMKIRRSGRARKPPTKYASDGDTSDEDDTSLQSSDENAASLQSSEDDTASLQSSSGEETSDFSETDDANMTSRAKKTRIFKSKTRNIEKNRKIENDANGTTDEDVTDFQDSIKVETDVAEDSHVSLMSHKKRRPPVRKRPRNNFNDIKDYISEEETSANVQDVKEEADCSDTNHVVEESPETEMRFSGRKRRVPAKFLE